MDLEAVHLYFSCFQEGGYIMTALNTITTAFNLGLNYLQTWLWNYWFSNILQIKPSQHLHSVSPFEGFNLSCPIDSYTVLMSSIAHKQ